MYYSPAVCHLIWVMGQKGVNEGDPKGNLEMGQRFITDIAL